MDPRRKRDLKLLVLLGTLMVLTFTALWLTSPQRNSIDCTATPRHCVD